MRDHEINRNQQPHLLFISHSLIKNSLKLISANFFCGGEALLQLRSECDGEREWLGAIAMIENDMIEVNFL